jgi:hypothetical protein
MENVLADGMNQAEARTPRLRKSLLWLLAMVAVLAVCVPLLVRALLLRTDYASGFTKAQFEQVQPGETLAAVLDRIKEPLNFAVISQRQDDSRFNPQYSDDVSTLSKWNSDATVLLILRYSKPRSPDGSYRAYEVWLKSGKVQETRAYNYWD